MAGTLKGNSRVMKGRLQAALYYMRKHNRERRDAATPEPPDPPQSKKATLTAGFLDAGGGVSIVGFAPMANVGSATSNPGDFVSMVFDQTIPGDPDPVTTSTANLVRTEGKESAVMTLKINGQAEDFTLTAAGDTTWGYNGTPFGISDGDTIEVTLTEN